MGGGDEGGDVGCCSARSLGLGMFGYLVGRQYGFSDGVGAFGSSLGIETVVPGCYVALEADLGMMVKRGGVKGFRSP